MLNKVFDDAEDHHFKLEDADTTQPELGPDLTNLQVSTDWKLGSDILHEG